MFMGSPELSCRSIVPSFALPVCLVAFQSRCKTARQQAVRRESLKSATRSSVIALCSTSDSVKMERTMKTAYILLLLCVLFLFMAYLPRRSALKHYSISRVITKE
jgi:uncharacterized membrane protein